MRGLYIDCYCSFMYCMCLSLSTAQSDAVVVHGVQKSIERTKTFGNL